MNESGPLIFFYDYVDPASFLLEMRLRGAGLVPGSSLHPIPFEANPPPNPLLDPDGGEWRDHWDRTLAAAEGSVPQLSRPWIVPWTRKAHELALYAAAVGSGPEIHETLFRAYLIEGRDIGRVDVLVELAVEHGLDAGDTKAVLDVDRYRGALETNRSRGIQAGVVRPPALLWNKKLLPGHPTPEELRSFLAAGANDNKP
ncbi:MAG: DsbA family oxidoreductase [Longimicrobiales bacterium]